MKYISACCLILLSVLAVQGQNTLPEVFLEGKSIVLISNAPSAKPILDWKDIAEGVHEGLVEAGGDPVAYFELEDLTLSEEVQAAYANSFNKRLISSVVILTRKSDGQFLLHIAPFSNSSSIISSTSAWSIDGKTIAEIKDNLKQLGQNSKSQNFLVLEVPEYPKEDAGQSGSSSTRRFFPRNPLNLDVFKLGVQLGGALGDAGILSAFRYDLIGKTEQAILAEQEAEKKGLQGIFEASYPHEVVYLGTAKTDAELLSERIQFLLVKVEGREADLMESMGLNPSGLQEPNRIVVKYYIRLIVRDELYLGPVWDADPNWRNALSSFLENLSIKQ
ncbi:MAG: NTPase [Mongoliibacter sp.]|uniref:NTPase n=1 Tax=Mongoliibacter sp. TaxID=2022438 RepID=UPI0012F31E56|nr:NTPase [Mongoliibacter sp.]TVP52765.1 MAG: NTPase [Mongoliibacter sp.]